MEHFSELHQLGQLDSSEAGEIFRAFLRGKVRECLVNVMAEEVAELCGRKHHPSSDAECRRAGSAQGVVLHEGRREKIVRPRVRRSKAEGRSEEVPLATYTSAQESGQLDKMLVAALQAGASGREMKRVHPESPRTSKSSVSRLWKREGAKLVAELRERDIASQDWLVLMLDGIRLSDDQLGIVALGVTSDGRKRILDFELGSSENGEVCRDLVSRLVSRGFEAKHGLLAVLDGATALKNSVLAFFPDAVIQRCLVHKESNLRGRLSKRHWGELRQLFRRLRKVQGEVAAREVYRDLERFLEKKNTAALESLREAGDELIALHCLEVPSTLHVSLLSTNLIENSFRNTRRKIGRVTRFRAETDQASRWLAAALLDLEKGFRRIRGCDQLPRLAEALERRSAGRGTTLAERDLESGKEDQAAAPVGASTPLRATPSAPSPPQRAKT
jgi:transposase-like protein